MAYTEDLRRKALFTLIEAIRDSNYFKEVYGRAPEKQIPGADSLPACFVALDTEEVPWINNEQKRGAITFAIFVFIHAATDDEANMLDIKKVEAATVIDRVLGPLHTNSAFTVDFTRVDVTTIDYGPQALEAYGIPLKVEAPFAATRIDAVLSYDYYAI